MDENTRMALVGMGLPLALGVVAGAGGSVLKRLVGNRTRASTGAEEAGIARAVAIVGLTMGLFVALFGVLGVPTWPLTNADGRVFLLPPIMGLLGLGGMLVTAWGGRKGGEGRLAWMVSAVCAGVGAAIGTAVVLGPSFWNGKLAGMGGMSGLVWVPLAFAAWAAGSASAVGSLARNGARVSAAVVLAGLAVAVGAGLVGESNTLGKLGFALAMPVVGLAAGALLVKGTAGPGGIGAACGMMGAMLGYGVFLGYTPWWVVIVLGCVAPAAVIAGRVVGSGAGRVGGAAVRIGAAVVVATMAVGPGVWALVKFVKGDG